MKKSLTVIAAFLFLTTGLSVNVLAESTGSDEQSLYQTIKSRTQNPIGKTGIANNLELDASVVIDGFYYYDNSEEGMAHLKEEISGFGFGHDHEGHSHGGLENGFNLRHIELGLSAAVDPYFRAWTTLAFDDGSTEIEGAVIQTTSLPAGLTLSGGKFFSGIGRLNRQHSHNWDFYDQPLVYELIMGDHNLVDTGVQLTWLAPTPFYLLFGVEAFNGENETMFQELESDELPMNDSPRLMTSFLKFSPDLGDQHALQLGFSFAFGDHQEAHASHEEEEHDDEEHDEDEHDEHAEHEEAFDHWLDGDSHMWGIDLVYKYDAKKEHGQGNFVFQAEYFNRKKGLTVVQHNLEPGLVGRENIDKQDGYYLQALYGVLPRWRVGLRYEQVGVTNEVQLPDLSEEGYDSSSRLAAMVDWKLSEFSLLRLQSAQIDFDTEEGSETAWEFALQWRITFGKHAAHDF